MANNHLQENLDDYVKGRISVSERRVLFTKWVGKTWEEISCKKDMIICSFKKCGTSVAIDGSEDNEINIESLKDYVVGESDEEATDDDADPFEDVDSDLTIVYTCTHIIFSIVNHAYLYIIQYCVFII